VKFRSIAEIQEKEKIEESKRHSWYSWVVGWGFNSTSNTTITQKELFDTIEYDNSSLQNFSQMENEDRFILDLKVSFKSGSLTLKKKKKKDSN